MRRFLCLLAAALLLPLPCFGESETPDAAFAVEDENTVFPPEEYEFDRRDSVRYESDTLIYTIESLRLDGTLCLLTKVWVQDPLRQIRKVNASWGESLSSSLQLFRQLPEAVLGTTVTVPTPAGDKVRVKIAPGTKNGTVLRIPDKGAPSLKKGEKRGALKVKLVVNVPDKLTDEQRGLVEKLAQTMDAGEVRRQIDAAVKRTDRK